MNVTTLVNEMAEVALLHQEIQKTDLLAKIPLEPKTIRLGCIRILEWLRMQAVAFNTKPLKLKQNSILDQSCTLLIEKDKYYLGKLFQIKDGSLSFSDDVQIEQARDLMLLAQEKYEPPIIRK
ncbi:MAG: hypothetical protein ACOYYU_04290 [Chloroflexota bacterium]